MSSPLSHRVTYFFFHSLFRDLPLRLSRMPCGQRPHQRREPGPSATGRGEGLSAHGPRGPRPLSSLITVRVGPETPCGTEAEPGRAARTSPSTGLRAASPVTVDYCPIVGGCPLPQLVELHPQWEAWVWAASQDLQGCSGTQRPQGALAS